MREFSAKWPSTLAQVDWEPPSPCRKTIVSVASGGPAMSAAILVPSASSTTSVRGAAAEVASASAARSTSSLVTLPPGPVASTVARSMPSSPARLRAAGEALTRPLESRAACRPSRATRGDGPPAAAVAPLEVATRACRSSSLRSSPGAVMTATAPITGTSLPTAATILRSTPLAGASTSSTAFSVSTVSRGTPSVTGSPSSRDQPVMVPEVMVRPHLGIVTIVGMRGLRVGQSVSRSVVSPGSSDDQTISRTASTMRSGLGT